MALMSDAEIITEARRYDALVLRVLAVLTEFDPQGLQPGKPDWAPIDEYWHEAQSFAQLLDEGGSINESDARDVWMNWFSNDLSHLSAEEIEQFVTALNGCVESDAPST
jgi:hypothetical protein